MKRFFIIFLFISINLFIQASDNIWEYNTDEEKISYFNINNDKIYMIIGKEVNGYINGKLICLDVNTGKEIWKFGKSDIFSNPYFLNEKIIFWTLGVASCGGGATSEWKERLYCINKDNGKTLWKMELMPKNSKQYGIIEDKSKNFFVLYDEKTNYYDIDVNSGKIKLIDNYTPYSDDEYFYEEKIPYLDKTIKAGEYYISLYSKENEIWRYDSDYEINNISISGNNLYFFTKKEGVFYSIEIKTGKIFFREYISNLWDGLYDSDIYSFKVSGSSIIFACYDGKIICKKLKALK